MDNVLRVIQHRLNHFHVLYDETDRIYEDE